jgi:hypothetical protein
LSAACEDKGAAEQVAQYRASLELPTTPVSYRDAMKSLVDQNVFGILERMAKASNGTLRSAAAKGHIDQSLDSFEVALDVAVRTDNLMRRADWSSFKSRTIDPDAFDGLVRRSLNQADELARAATARRTSSVRLAAEQLLSTCQSCHERYR